MKLRIPPVFLVVIFALAMWGVDAYLPFGEFDFFGRRGLIWVLAIAAMLTCLLALAQLIRHRTTIDPAKPGKASSLVTGGIFSYTRNPIYLSMLMLLLAWGLWLGNAFNTLLAAAFVAYMNRFQIGPEEEALQQRFGNTYKKYLVEVRRWF